MVIAYTHTMKTSRLITFGIKLIFLSTIGSFNLADRGDLLTDEDYVSIMNHKFFYVSNILAIFRCQRISISAIFSSFTIYDRKFDL